MYRKKITPTPNTLSNIYESLTLVHSNTGTPWTDAEDEKIREQWEDVKDMESRCQVLCLEDVRSHMFLRFISHSLFSNINNRYESYAESG